MDKFHSEVKFGIQILNLPANSVLLLIFPAFSMDKTPAVIATNTFLVKLWDLNGHKYTEVPESLRNNKWIFTGSHVISRPARKYPRTLLRLPRHTDFEKQNKTKETKHSTVRNNHTDLRVKPSIRHGSEYCCWNIESVLCVWVC